MKPEDSILDDVHEARRSVLEKSGSFDELVKLLQQKESMRAEPVIIGKPLAPVVIPEAA